MLKENWNNTLFLCNIYVSLIYLFNNKHTYVHRSGTRVQPNSDNTCWICSCLRVYVTFKSRKVQINHKRRRDLTMDGVLEISTWKWFTQQWKVMTHKYSRKIFSFKILFVSYCRLTACSEEKQKRPFLSQFACFLVANDTRVPRIGMRILIKWIALG